MAAGITTFYMFRLSSGPSGAPSPRAATTSQAARPRAGRCAPGGHPGRALRGGRPDPGAGRLARDRRLAPAGLPVNAARLEATVTGEVLMGVISVALAADRDRASPGGCSRPTRAARAPGGRARRAPASCWRRVPLRRGLRARRSSSPGATSATCWPRDVERAGVQGASWRRRASADATSAAACGPPRPAWCAPTPSRWSPGAPCVGVIFVLAMR